jgi:trimeric autotransporter adhesin
VTHVAIARRLGRSLLLVAFVCVAYGQGVITTIAGNDAIFTADGVAATNAPLSGAFGFGLAADHAGNFYIADPENHVVLRVTRDGLLNIVGGNGIPSFSGDGNSARTASLLGPSAIAVDADGNVIIADYGNHAIRRINTAGVIESVAGNGRAGYSGDTGPALSASMTFPVAVKVDRAGNIYFASNVDKVRFGGLRQPV